MTGSRLRIVFIFLGLWGAVVLGRLVQLQCFRGEVMAEDVLKISTMTVKEVPRRGSIVDRNGHYLAVSLSVPSICAYPPFIKDVDETAARLSPVLGLPVKRLAKKLGASRRFVWLSRQVPESVGDAVFHLHLSGVGIRHEYRRNHPYKTAAGILLGTLGVDHQGLAGLEYEYDAALRGKTGVRLIMRDARHRKLDLNLPLKNAVPGKDLHLTLDVRVQHAAEREAAAAWEQNHCKHAVITVMDPVSGEIYAHALYPPTDPSTPKAYFATSRVNYLANGLYEPGSIFKPIVAASALQEGTITMDEILNGHDGRITAYGRVIHDHKPFGEISFAQALIHSSNVVFVQVGLGMMPKTFSGYLRRCGLGEKTGIDFPGEERGILPRISRWQETTSAYLALGQEIAVTNAQMLRVYSALATDGTAVTPHLNREIKPRRKRLFHVDVIRKIKPVLAEVVTGGTGQRANVAWVRVAGKTGTAQKAFQGKGYVKGKYVSSFIGWFPVYNPRFIVLVSLDEPEGAFYGGEVAAPIFSRIVSFLCVLDEIYET